MKRVVWAAAALLIIASVIGAFALDEAQERAQPDVSQGELDDFWRMYIREQADADQPSEAVSGPDPGELCENMLRIANGDAPTGEGAWPSRDVAEEYADAFCR
jgi:hypothetical protein